MRLSSRFTVLAASFIVTALFSLTACRKERFGDDDTSFGADHAILEKTFSDAQSITDEAGTDGSLSTFRQAATILSNCASITNDTISIPHVLTIDFGSSNCLCHDNNLRRGQIIVLYTGHYRDPNYTHTISFNNYFVNDNQVLGTKTVVSTGVNTLGQPTYSITVNGQIIKANNNGTVSWSASRIRTWTAGYNTPSWQDDEYLISGSGTVTRANNTTFTINITTPLQVALSCNWIESGVVSITPQGASARTLDYGSGTCDDQATFTVNGNSHSITLKH